MTDPLQYVAAAILIVLYLMIEYWPATLGALVLIALIVIQKKSGKTL